MAYWARVTLTVAGALVVLAAAWMVRHVLLLVLVAAVLAVGLDPQVRWLQRRRLSRGGAVTIILLLSVGLLVLFAWLVLPSAVRQTQALAKHTPDYLNRSWTSRSHESAATSPATSSSRSSRGRWRSLCWKSCGCLSRRRWGSGWRSPTSSPTSVRCLARCCA